MPLNIILVHMLNGKLCAELTFNYSLKMLGEKKRSILNVNLKKTTEANSAPLNRS